MGSEMCIRDRYLYSCGGFSGYTNRSTLSASKNEQILKFAKISKIQRRIIQSMRHCKPKQVSINLLLHAALRNKSNAPVRIGNCNIMPIVFCYLAKMSAFTDAMQNSLVKGSGGKPLTTVAVISSGTYGVDNQQVINSLQHYCESGLKILFLQNAKQLDETITDDNIESTLFLVMDRIFCDPVTLALMQKAKHKLAKKYASTLSVDRQFIAVTSSSQNAIDNGIAKKNIFLTPSWQVNGFSIWSSLGLPFSLAIGSRNYGHFLQGAFEVDQHVLNVPVAENILILSSLSRCVSEKDGYSKRLNNKLNISADTLKQEQFWSEYLVSALSGILKNTTPKSLGAVLAIAEHMFIHQYLLDDGHP